MDIKEYLPRCKNALKFLESLADASYRKNSNIQSEYHKHILSKIEVLKLAISYFKEIDFVKNIIFVGKKENEMELDKFSDEEMVFMKDLFALCKRNEMTIDVLFNYLNLIQDKIDLTKCWHEYFGN